MASGLQSLLPPNHRMGRLGLNPGTALKGVNMQSALGAGNRATSEVAPGTSSSYPKSNPEPHMSIHLYICIFIFIHLQR